MAETFADPGKRFFPAALGWFREEGRGVGPLCDGHVQLGFGPVRATVHRAAVRCVLEEEWGSRVK